MGPEKSKDLLRKAYDSLVPGGLVVVRESLLNDEGTSPLPTVLFSLNMMLHTGEGQSYSGAEVMSLMEDVGFVEPKVISIPEVIDSSLVISIKP